MTKNIERKNKSKPSTPFIEKWTFKLTISLVVAFFLMFSLIIINPFNEIPYIINIKPGQGLISDIIWFFIIGWCITEFSLYVSRLVGRFLPWEKSVSIRFAVQILIQCVCIIIVMFILILITDFLISLEAEKTTEDWLSVRQILFMSIILSIIVTTIYSGSHLVSKWKKSILEAAELRQISLESQLQSLKLQLDPHFLFNNFSTLSSLISENPSTAQDFLESLSQVHRYMLFNLNKNLISLQDELDFIESYIYLLKIRFGENLNIKITDVDHYLEKGIPPITIQVLLENAVKHNVASRTQPLHVHIYCKDDFLVVSNNLQKISYSVASSMIGLKNIEDRYRLLSDRFPLIEETNTQFIVKVPLLDLTK